MKKFFYSFAVFAAMMTFAACTNDIPEGPGQAEQDVIGTVNNIMSRANGRMNVNSTPLVGPEITEESFTWTDPLKVLEIFPEFITPEGNYDNFLFVSNGEPFDLVMLYSNGGYRHELGLYWYDESGVRHEENVWDEFVEEAKKPKTWVNANGQKTDQISRISDNAGAYKVQLPKGTKFGFFVTSRHNNAERNIVTESVRLDPPAGPIVACEYKFYSEQELNWNYKLLNKDGNLACQAMCNNNIDDWTVVGFEDISLTSTSCDKDFNDCVFAMNPKQHVEGEPVSESVETNLSVADKGSYDQVKLSMHIRANTDIKVVLPIADEVLADDFAIVAKHDVEASYSEPIEIANKTVELIYSITEKGYLQIETKGITQEILDYCNDNYADGLTFECNLAYGKFVLEDQPTITFSNEPTYYVTSCVNNSPEAKDVEVVWTLDGVNKIFENPKFGPEDGLNYTHRFYSTKTLEELQAEGWLRNLTE